MYDKKDLFEQKKELVSKYAVSVNIPQYLPKDNCPKLYDCFSDKKYKELLYDINTSNVTEEEKEFLRLAATRHLIFIYSQIADYYAHASKEMQQLMEKSALVIIDFEDAIANGYVKLSQRINEIAIQSDNYKQKLQKYNRVED